MPRKAKRPCSHQGCPALVEIGQRWCEKHKRDKQRQQDRWRGTAASRGYDSEWRRLRDLFLFQNPLCAECLRNGKIKAGEHVDHIKPFDGKDDPLRLDPTNLQTLCRECHSRKTAKEDGGFGHGTR